MYTDRGSAYRGKCKQCIAGDLRLLGELRPHRENAGHPKKWYPQIWKKEEKLRTLSLFLNSLLPEII
jgi:hypothetical protein